MSLNSLQHGVYAVDLQEKLLRAGYRQREELYQWFKSEIAGAFGAGPADEQLLAKMAAQVWCQAQQMGRFWTKAGKSSEIKQQGSRVLSATRIRIHDQVWRRGLVFWKQRNRYWTLDRMIRAAQGQEPAAPPGGYRLEQKWRRRRFQGRKRGKWAQLSLEREYLRRMSRRRPPVTAPEAVGV